MHEKLPCIFAAKKVTVFPAQKCKHTVRNLETSHSYIFCILQHFATKLRSFTNYFKRLFPAMTKDVPKPNLFYYANCLFVRIYCNICYFSFYAHKNGPIYQITRL